ncbi:3-ketoacyl-CoA synthase 5, partial [Bienertia sinuspersici]
TNKKWWHFYYLIIITTNTTTTSSLNYLVHFPLQFDDCSTSNPHLHPTHSKAVPHLPPRLLMFPTSGVSPHFPRCFRRELHPTRRTTKKHHKCTSSRRNSLKRAMTEVQHVLFTVTETLLTKHKIKPKSIDILVTNCSINCPTPSLAALVINKFGFRMLVYSRLAWLRTCLRCIKNSLALVLSTETICSNVYKGRQKSMLLANCLFRMGGAGILLSNRKCDREVAKYELQHIVRTHLGAKDDAYRTPMRRESRGVTLQNGSARGRGSIENELDHARASSVTLLGAIQFAFNLLLKKLRAKKQGPNIPKFKRRLIIFASSGGRLGFKCNSAVWKCISKLEVKDVYNAWSDRINSYPVHVPEIMEH